MRKINELLLVSLAKVTHRRRALLCALARRGKLLRLERPARAKSLLTIISNHSFYRSGRLVFDMAEVAEALRNGPPPAHIDDESLGQLMRPMAEALEVPEVVAACRAVPDERATGSEPPRAPGARSFRGEWPQLEHSDSLYELIALGVVEVLLSLPPATRRERESVASSA